MSLEFRLDGTLLDSDRVYVLPDENGVSGLTQAALDGEVSVSRVRIQDPDGDLTFNGWKTFTVDETAATPTRIGTWFVAERTIHRGEWTEGSGRVYDVDLVDLNTILTLRRFRGETWKRDHESDITRINALLASDFLNGLVFDNGLVGTATPINFNETDYRKQTPLDMLAQLAPIAGKRFFLYWDPDADEDEEISLFYEKPAAEVYTSSVQISNDKDDAYDGTALWHPYQDATVERSPSEVNSGVFLAWRGGELYLSDADTGTAFIERDGEYGDDRIGRLETAQAVAAAWLDQFDTESDLLSFTVRVAKENVNLLLAGQRAQVKLTHVPGYESFVYVRMTRRTVRLTRSKDWYEIDFQATQRSPASVGGGGAAGNFPYQGVCAGGEEDLASGLTATGSVSLLSGSGGLPTWSTGKLGNPFDGNTGTGATWTGNHVTGGVQTIASDLFVDLSSARSVGSIRLRMGTVVTVGDMSLSYAADLAGPWTEIWSQASVGGSANIDDDFASASARYWRLRHAFTTTPGFAHVGPFIATWELGECITGLPAPGQPVNDVAPDETPDGATTAFTAPHPYADGSMRVLVNGIDVTEAAVTESDPATGTFTLSPAPWGSDEISLYYLGR